MTTDDFTTAARAEAEMLFLNSTNVPSPQDIGEHVAVWARDHLNAQELIDAEVDAAARALAASVAGGIDVWDGLSTDVRNTNRADARAALTAARAVGQR